MPIYRRHLRGATSGSGISSGRYRHRSARFPAPGRLRQFRAGWFCVLSRRNRSSHPTVPAWSVVGEAQRHVAARAAENVDQDTKPVRAARYLVEQYGGAVILADHDLGGESDVFFPGRPVDPFSSPSWSARSIQSRRVFIGELLGGVRAGGGSCCPWVFPEFLLVD